MSQEGSQAFLMVTQRKPVRVVVGGESFLVKIRLLVIALWYVCITEGVMHWVYGIKDIHHKYIWGLCHKN